MEVIKNFPDSEIVSNIRSGIKTDETIKAIYRMYFNSLSWHIINNSGSKEDAEDIFQEVVLSFIDLVQKDKFRGESSVKTFLFSLNRNLWLNELKRKGRALVREEKFEKGQERLEMDFGLQLDDREGKQAVISVVEQLGETCKKILILFYYENLPMKDIVGATNFENEQVVRNKKYKCLKQLEQLLEANPTLKETLKNLLHG
ncbi:MAG: sigma-70 family RNA polymerase sigma factor [Chitinophagaceae bacterium]|nr:sigma-70 family RNA polymerase sigma factor [Chitinophagaceae bacterium]